MDLRWVRGKKATNSNLVDDPISWEHIYGYTDINNKAE